MNLNIEKSLHDIIKYNFEQRNKSYKNYMINPVEHKKERIQILIIYMDSTFCENKKKTQIFRHTGISTTNYQRCHKMCFYLMQLCLPQKGWETYCFSPGVRQSVCLSVCYESCPLCNLKTPEAIFTKLHTNINQH